MAGRKAQGVLRACMLRRKKVRRSRPPSLSWNFLTPSFILDSQDSKLNGRELISLPDKTVELREIEFSEEEREICTPFPPLHLP